MVILQRRTFLKSLLLSSTFFRIALSGVPSQAAWPLDAANDDRNPVYYWNRRALNLITLDHSISPRMEVQAPGPCATARMLGLVHAVIADAVVHVYKPDYKPLFSKAAPPEIGPGDPAVFVGGAAWGFLRFVYKHERFTPDFDRATQDVKQIFVGSFDKSTWDAGVAFGTSTEFTSHWDAALILKQLVDDQSYTPTAFGDHKVDPLNPDQMFYGISWSQQPPLILDKADMATFVEEIFKERPDIDQDELDFLIAKGGEVTREAGKYKARVDPAQSNTGIFWAYDGAPWIGVPPILYNLAIAKVAKADGLIGSKSIPTIARIFAVSNLALADSSIVAWEAKWRLKLWRPVVGVRAMSENEANWRPLGSPRSNPSGMFPLGRDTIDDREPALKLLSAQSTPDSPPQTILGASANPATAPDPQYAKAAFTPNFPSYPSGHATFGGAVFKSLLNLRSETHAQPNNISVSLRSAELNGVTRDNRTNEHRDNLPKTFKRLLQLGSDRRKFDTESFSGSNDISRIYLGVHWSFDQTDGNRAGQRVADIVYNRAYRP
jgi:membrane-associated phospholipid phosphatase